jgi:hypothetical protein
MNTKILLKLSALLLVMLFVTASAFAQGLATIYVDVTNGSDTYTGANPNNSPAGTGPVNTINKGLSLLADNGTLVIFAGTYLGGDGLNGDVDINTTTYTNLVTGLTIESRTLGGNSIVDLNTGNFIYNVSAGVLSFNATTNAETFKITAGNLTLGSTSNASTIAIPNKAYVTLRSSGTIFIYKTSAFSNQGPTKGTNLNLQYLDSGSLTAGQESNQTSFGSGVLTVNKSAGTLVTFPYAMTFTGSNDAINITSGDATFNGAITLGADGTSSATGKTADIVVGAGASASSATFNGAVTLWNGFNAGNVLITDAQLSTIENQGTGTVTFGAAVQWNIWALNGGGTVTAVAAQTAGLNDVTAAVGSGTSLVRNVVGGSVLFNSTVTASTSNLTSPSTGDMWYNVTVENVLGGTVTFAQGISTAVTTGTTSGSRLVTINMLNSGAGTMSFSGTLRGFVTNAASGGTININGATTTYQAVTNAGGATIALGANAWTWGTGSATAASTSGTTWNNAGTATLGAGTLTDATAATSTITVTTGGITISGGQARTITGGTLGNVTVSATGGTIFNANPVTFTNFTTSNSSGAVTLSTAVTATNETFGGGGTVAMNANQTVSGTMTVSGATITDAGGLTHTVAYFSQTGGTLNVGAATTLNVTNDFNRTAGVFSAGAASTLAFNGTTSQALNGGPLLSVQNLTFNNIGNTITLGQSIRTKNVTIAAGTNVALGTLNIILNVAGATMSNSGSYTASGGGGVVFGGVNTVSGGLAIAGASFSASGTGTYSYLTIDVGANTVGVSGITRFNGVLTLKSGTLDVTGGDFGPTGSAASIIRDVVLSVGITTSGGTFNSTHVPYDLTYIGILAANVSSGSELNADVRSWNVNVTGDTDADGDFTTGTQYYVEVAGNGAGTLDLTFAGALSISNISLVRVKGDGGNATNIKFNLTGTGVTHHIYGRLTTAEAGDWIQISGASVTLDGSIATADDATIGNIVINSTTNCTISGVQKFEGKFTTGATSVVTLAMGSNTTTAATLASEQYIVGPVVLGGTSLTLGSNIEAQGGVTVNAGSLNFGAYNLKLTTGGNFSQTAGTSTTGGGFLVMDNAGSTLTLLNTAAGALPNLQILANTTLTAAGRVSGLLDIGDPTAVPVSLTLGAAGNDLTFTGTAILLQSDGTGTFDAVIGDGTTNGTAGGKLVVTSTAATITANADVRIEELTYNPTGGAGTLTFASDVAKTARTFTIRDIFTHPAGTIALGKNNIAFTGTGAAGVTRAYVRTATSASAATVTATTGTFQFDAVATFTPGTGFSVPNLTVNGGLTSSTPTIVFTVTGTLDLTAGALTTNASTLTLADGATIIRRAAGAVLTNNATFAGKVNVDYEIAAGTNADITTDRELPGSATGLKDLTINNPDATVGPPPDPYNIVLAKAITVNGTLYLVAGELDVATFSVTMADSSTINKGLGNFESFGGATDKPVVTNYNLVYSTGGIITSTNKELPAATGIKVLSLQVLADANDNATTLILHANRTVGNLVLGGVSEIQLDLGTAAHVLTVSGNLDLSGGTITSATSVTSSELALVGTTAQTITVPAAGYGLVKEINLRLNNAAGFTLTGGNFRMSSNATRTAGNTIFFVNGVLSTGANSVVLAQTTVGQGTDRSGVTGTNVSHIAGKVRHSIPGGAGNSSTYANGRFEFPTGTATLYRPMAITFTNTYPAISPTNVDVSMVDVTPAGRVGLPLDGGNGVRIGNYPAYYWLVATTPSSFTASQQFDVEVQGTNLGYPFTSAGDLRIIRRQDGNADINPWQMQGTSASYLANYINVGTNGDSTIFVRSSSSLGGLVNQGSRFTIGIPTRPPVFTTAPTTSTVDENTTLTVQFTGDPQDIGETVAYSLVSPPAGASINSVSGVFTWKPTYAQAGTYNVVVSITDGQFTTTTTDTITVNNVNRAPAFSPKTMAVTVKDTDTLKVTLAATDADSDPVTYSVISVTPATTAAPVVSGTTLTWKPAFADAGNTYAILVLASDGVTTGNGPKPGTDTLTVNVTVNRSIARGDVDKNGTVSAADASLVLKHVAGLQLITDPAALYAADATGNGQITAYDAAYILYYASFGSFPTAASSTDTHSLAKMGEAAGTLSWSSPEATKDVDVLKVGLNISNSANVYAVQLSSRLNASLASVEGVNAAIPEGWEMQWSFVSGELRVAMAGATPLPSGTVATIMVRLKDKESRLSFSTDAVLNEAAQSVGAVEVAAVPATFALDQNYPNPFNPSTTVRYQIPNNANVNLDIYNLQGQKIRTLVSKEQKAGYYSVVWDGRNEAGQTVSSGLYLYRVQAGSFVATHKMLMIK